MVATRLHSPIRPDDHLAWATAVGRRVSLRYRFPWESQEQADIEQAAVVAMLKAVLRFDPARCPPGGDMAGLFRGWCRCDVNQESQREARRLLNGGCYRTRREWESPRLLKAFSFSDLASRDVNNEYDLPDRFRDDAVALPDDRPPPLFDLSDDDMPPARGRSVRYAPEPRATPCTA